MKRYPFLSVLLIIAALPLSGCNQITNSQKEPDNTKTVINTEETTPPSVPTEDISLKENTVKIQTYSENKSSKYSSDKELIYELDIREPEVIIPDNLQAQYRLNRYLRKNDITDDEYYTFIADADDYYSTYKETQNFLPAFSSKADYTVLKNDGRILSLKRDNDSYTGGAHGFNYSAFHSYDTKTGQKIILDSLTDDPDKLKLSLRQDIANQLNARFGNSDLSKAIMSADMENVVLLSEGIQIYYNTYELGDDYTLGSQKFLIPYDTIKNQLNEYGKEITTYASRHNDEPKTEAPITSPDYIFSKSNTAYLTGEDLLLVDESTLRLARNEIYARHGRKFKSSDLQSYFDEKQWYTPTVDSDSFDEEVLNKYEKKNLIAIKATEEQLKSKKIQNGFVTLDSDRKYMLDLDGDGNCESISWSTKSIDEYNETLTLSINGQKQTCIDENEHYGFDINAVDLKRGDGEVELQVYIPGDSTVFSSSFYRYKNGKLEPIANLTNEILSGAGYLFRYSDLRANGNGILKVKADSPFSNLPSGQFGCYYVDLLYSYDNGKLEEIPQEIYPLKDYRYLLSAFCHEDDNNFYIVSNEFTAMTQKGGNTPAFQAKPGETVCPVAWSIKGDTLYVLAMNEAGACGWVKDIPMNYGDDNNYYQNFPAWG